MDQNFLPEKRTDESFPEPPEELTFQTSEAFGLPTFNLFKYIKAIIYILVFLVPLFFLPWTSEILEFNKQFLLFVLVGIGLILYLAQVIKNGQLIFKKNFGNYGVLIFLGATLLVSLFSEFRYQSIFGGFNSGFYESFITTITFSGLFFLILNVFGGSSLEKNSNREETFQTKDSSQDTKKILGVFYFSLVLSLLIGLLQILGIPLFKIFGLSLAQSLNTIGTLNSLGIISAVLLTLSFSKIWSDSKKKLINFIRLPSLFLSLFFLIILNWWLLWVIAISGLIFILIFNSLSQWKISNYFWPSTIIVLAVIFILLGFNLGSLLNFNIPLEVAPSFKASLNIIKQVILKDPLFGIGPENFALAYDLYKPISINNTLFWNARFFEASSALFNFIIGGGIVSLLGFLGLLWSVFKLSFKKERAKYQYSLFAIFATFLAAYILYPFNITLGFGFWVLFSLLALDSSKREDEVIVNLEKSPRYSLITSILFVTILVLAVIGFYFMILNYWANIKFAKAFTVQDVNKKTQLFADAVNLNRKEDLYKRTLADFLISRISQEVQNLNDAKTDEERQTINSRIQNFSATAINLGVETTANHPKDSDNWFSRGLIYENLVGLIAGADDWAIKMYQEYTKFAPKDPKAYLRIGNIHLSRADLLRQALQGSTNLTQEARQNAQNQISSNLKSAEENFKKALELKQNYILAIYNLGVVYERENRIKDAIRQLEITRSVNPLDANLAFQLGLLYYRDNQKENSFNELQRALNIFPDFSNARWYLALLYEERGEIEKALNELEKIKKLNPDNQVLENKIKELKAGKRSIPPEKVTGVKPLEEKEKGGGK